jgi:hypothetical protein
MKNNEIIQISAMVILAGALLYRKYGKKIKAGQKNDGRIPGKSIFSSQAADEDYEPYSKKEQQ